MSLKTAPFKVCAWTAIVVAGGIAAASAHAPQRHIIWLVAYLVLIVGAAQYALGHGQLVLSDKKPALSTIWAQWAALNLGQLGIITGTLMSRFGLVAAASLIYMLTVAWFGWRVRHAERSLLLLAWRAMVIVLLAAALVGLALSAIRR